MAQRFRADIVIATLALLASASASIATVVQTHVLANQLSASVWPYLGFETTLSPASIDLALTNDGLGPALVRSVHLSLDGKPVARWRDAIASIAASGPLHPGHGRLTVHGLSPGSVIRPGTSLSLLHFESAAAPRLAEATRTRVIVNVCYCSILQNCWRIDDRSGDPPAEVRSCGAPSPPLEY